MIDYTICEYGEMAGMPMVRVTFNDFFAMSADEVVERIRECLSTDYSPTGTFRHQFTEQKSLLCFDGAGKHDPMNYQYFMIEVLIALGVGVDVPKRVLVHTTATIPLEDVMREFLGTFEKPYDAPFYKLGCRWMHFVIDLQTFTYTKKADMVRTDIIKTYICDVGNASGWVNVIINEEEGWNEILAYTAILQAKLFVEDKTLGIRNRMIPVWIYPTTKELAEQSMKRGFYTYWRPCDV